MARRSRTAQLLPAAGRDRASPSFMGRAAEGAGGSASPRCCARTEYVVPRDRDRRCAPAGSAQESSTHTVADNGAAAGIVVGGRPVGPLDVGTCAGVGGIMYKKLRDRGRPGVAAGVLGHPAVRGCVGSPTSWGSHGVTLEPGHLVAGGPRSRARGVRAKGDTLHGRLSAAPRRQSRCSLF